MADFGGQLGLWMGNWMLCLRADVFRARAGVSVITVLEFVIMVSTVLTIWCRSDGRDHDRYKSRVERVSSSLVWSCFSHTSRDENVFTAIRQNHTRAKRTASGGRLMCRKFSFTITIFSVIL